MSTSAATFIAGFCAGGLTVFGLVAQFDRPVADPLIDNMTTRATPGPFDRVMVAEAASPVAPVEETAPLAQAPTAAPTAPGAPRPVNDGPVVDETALRYFARQGDTRRLEAEIARLKALYPDWVPPADPLAVQSNSDPRIDAMWQLYSEGNYAEIRKAITEAQSTDAAFQPPQDLLDRLAIGESRLRLVNASDLKQFETVVQISTETPSLLTCGDVDVLWRLAEAFAKTERPDRAKDAYLYVLTNCTDAAERVATVDKALPLLPRDQIEELLAQERVGADGKGEFATARTDLLRRNVAAGGKEQPEAVAAADVDALTLIAEKEGLASDALLLGWYHLRAEDAAGAETWFRRALDRQEGAEPAQGLSLALLELKRPADAETILFKWRDASDEVRKVYLAAVANMLAQQPPPDLSPEVLGRMATAVGAAKDAAAAQQFGWYAHALGQEKTAVQWFTSALNWNPDEEPAAYGLALVSHQLGDKARVLELQRLWAGRSERIAKVTDRPGRRSEIRNQPEARRQASTDIDMIETSSSGAISTVSDRPAAAPAVRGCVRTEQYSNMSGSAALNRGWCLLDLNRPIEAAGAFEQAIRDGSPRVRSDAAWGQSLAYLKAGLTDEAAVAASKAPQSRERQVELEASILSTRASNFFDQKRYSETLLVLDQRARIAPERLDLMVLRGYAYVELRRLDEARRVFETLAAAGSKEGRRGLGVITAVTGGGN